MSRSTGETPHRSVAERDFFLDLAPEPESAPSDTWVETDYTFRFRHADGPVDTVHETHRTGLFPNAVWERLLDEAGFEPAMVTEETSEERLPRVFFVGHCRRAG